MTNAPIKTISKTFDIIDRLMELDGAGVTQLATELEMPKTTVHAYLKTLEDNNIVCNDGGTYHLSLEMLDYGGYTRKEMDLYPAAWREVQNLALETQEHANLMIEEFRYGRYIYISEGAESATLDTYTGMTVHLHSTALGKAILASMDRDRVESIVDARGLPECTENTITAPEELFDELDEIRAREYARNHQERVFGVDGVAMPIKHEHGETIGAVGVSGPTSRIQEKIETEDILKKVEKTTNIIELNLSN